MKSFLPSSLSSSSLKFIILEASLLKLLIEVTFVVYCKEFDIAMSNIVGLKSDPEKHRGRISNSL